MKRILLAVLCALVALPLFAQSFPVAHGDVLVSVSVYHPIDFPPSAELWLLDANGQLKAKRDLGGVRIAIANNGDYYLTGFNTILIADAKSADLKGQLTIPNFYPVALAFNSFNHLTDNLFILSTTLTLCRVVDGGVVWSQQLPGFDPQFGNIGTASIDIAADQCTLLYTYGLSGGIRRYDTCNLQALTAIAPEMRYDNVRALSDGGFVATHGNSLDFYNTNGNVVFSSQYETSSPIIGLAFDADSANIWIATGDGVTKKVRIRDRVILASVPSVVFVVTGGIAVSGETRPTIASILGLGRFRGVRH